MLNQPMIRILIAEDDPMVAELNRRYILKIPGFTFVGIAHNGNSALQMLRNNPVDLVLLDIYMPQLDGIQLLKQIREKHYQVDVLFVTAARDLQFIQTALRLGAVDYLIKPFEFQRFLYAMESYRRRKTVFHEGKEISQEEFDNVFHSLNPFKNYTFPKGIDKVTYKLIWDIMQKTVNLVSAEEVSALAGISRVTAKRYLDFLTKCGLVEQEASYGTVGRPLFRYSLKK